MNHRLLVSWFTAFLLITLLRAFLLIIYQRTREAKRRYYVLFIVGVTITAFLWGMMASVLMPPGLDYQAFVVILVAGVTAGATLSLSPSRLASSLFVFLAITPLAVWLFYQVDELHALVGVTILVYIGFIVGATYRNNHLLISSLRLSFENNVLADYLGSAKSVLENTNTKLVSEIAERKQLEEKLNYMATHDGLTGIINRSCLHTRLNEIIAKAKRHHWKFCLLFIDLDGFKGINDVYGHDVGDELLKQVTQRIQSKLRATDIFARFGGDEFIIIFEDVQGRSFIEQRIAEINQAFIKPIIIKELTLPVAMSIGVAIYPHDGTNEIVLLKNADEAMYTVKQSGGNKFGFGDESAH